MKPAVSNPKEHFRQINLFFIAFFLGIVILFGASVFVKITGNLRFTFSISREIGIMFKISLGIFIIILFPLSYILHKRKIEKLKAFRDLSQKISAYKASLIIKLVMIEYLCVFSLVTFFLFGGPFLLIPVSVFLLILLMNRPTIERISTELNLTIEEREELVQS